MSITREIKKIYNLYIIVPMTASHFFIDIPYGFSVCLYDHAIPLICFVEISEKHTLNQRSTLLWLKKKKKTTINMGITCLQEGIKCIKPDRGLRQKTWRSGQSGGEKSYYPYVADSNPTVGRGDRSFKWDRINRWSVLQQEWQIKDP
jgi:hypothetical protein